MSGELRNEFYALSLSVRDTSLTDSSAQFAYWPVSDEAAASMIAVRSEQKRDADWPPLPLLATGARARAALEKKIPSSLHTSLSHFLTPLAHVLVAHLLPSNVLPLLAAQRAT
ncbi:hypothetical protein MTO96_016162 [Rhipicephalus appendiculatus]